MSRVTITAIMAVSCLFAASLASAGGHDEMIASALGAGPPSVTNDATIKATDGTVLREGSNEYTCYPGSDAIGAMCNPPEWDRFMAAFMAREDFTAEHLSISFMLRGDADGQGVSNSDPFHPDPPSADDFIVEGPHLMILVPDKSMLEGISRNPEDPVYVMWADTPYAHIMVKVQE